MHRSKGKKNTVNVSGNIAYDRTSHILIVDDDNTLLKFFKIHLNKFFSKIIVADGAKEALDTLKEKEIDLVISDLRMPKIDGIELLQKVKKSYKDVPFLIVSGALLTEEQSKIIENTADGFLKKPFSVDGLHDFIVSGMALREKWRPTPKEEKQEVEKTQAKSNPTSIKSARDKAKKPAGKPAKKSPAA